MLFFNNSNKLFYYNIRSRERRFTSCPHAGYFLKTIMLWWAEGNVFVQSPSLSHTLHVYMCLHAITYSHACIHMVFSPKNKMQTHSQTHKHTHSQTHTRATFLDSELRQPIISFNPFIMFLFSFPPVWGKKKVNANRNSGIQRKTHSLRLRKQEQGIFWGEEGRLCAEGTHVCIAIWREEERRHCSDDCVTCMYMWVCYLRRL